MLDGMWSSILMVCKMVEKWCTQRRIAGLAFCWHLITLTGKTVASFCGLPVMANALCNLAVMSCKRQKLW